MSAGIESGVRTANGTGNGNQRNLGAEIDLEIKEEENGKGSGGIVQQNGAKSNVENKTEQKNEGKKQKISIEMGATDLKEIDVLVTLGIYKSRDEFISEAVIEKKTEVMAKLKTAVKKK